MPFVFITFFISLILPKFLFHQNPAGHYIPKS